jgi:hypothetical protein
MDLANAFAFRTRLAFLFQVSSREYCELLIYSEPICETVGFDKELLTKCFLLLHALASP